MSLKTMFQKKRTQREIRNLSSTGYRYTFLLDFLDDSYPFGSHEYEGMELHIDVYENYCYVRNRFYRSRTHGVEHSQIAEPQFADELIAYLNGAGLVSYKSENLPSDYTDFNHLTLKTGHGEGKTLSIMAGRELTEEFKNIREKFIEYLCDRLASFPSGFEYSKAGGYLGEKFGMELKAEEGHLFMDVITQKHRSAPEEIMRSEMFPELLLEVWKRWKKMGGDSYKDLPPAEKEPEDGIISTFQMNYSTVLISKGFSSKQEIPPQGQEIIQEIFDLIKDPGYQK